MATFEDEDMAVIVSARKRSEMSRIAHKFLLLINAIMEKHGYRSSIIDGDYVHEIQRAL